MTTPIVGIDEQFFVAIETTYDTRQAVATGDSVGLIELNIQPSQEFHAIIEHRGTASLQGEIEGKRGGKWDATFNVKPNASGTPPDSGPFFQAGMGTQTGSNYTLIGSGTPASLQIVRRCENSLYEVINGAWIEQIETETVGNAEPTVKVSGGFASYGWLYGIPLTNGSAVATSATTFTLSTASIGKLGAGARFSFATDTGTAGAGYAATSVSAAGVVVFTPGLVGAGIAASATAIVPATPTNTLSGTIIGGIACGLTIAATEVGFISYKLTLDTGIHGLDKEANTNRPNRLSRGDRKLSGSAQFYFLDENVAYLGDAWNGTTRALSHRAGPDTTANRMIVSTPSVRMSISEVKIPAREEATYEMTFVPRQSAAAEDELAINFT